MSPTIDLRIDNKCPRRTEPNAQDIKEQLMTKEQEDLIYYPEEVEIGNISFSVSYNEDSMKYTLEDYTCCGYQTFIDNVLEFDTKQEVYNHLKIVLEKIKSDIENYLN